jgi:signal transduction histidine kinase/CheY-like chemotaxis protein
LGNLELPPVGSRPLNRLYWTLVASAVLAGLIAAATIAVGIARQSEDEWVRHTLAVRNQIGLVLSLVQRAETGQRGYLLTGRDIYLAPYEQARKQLPLALKELGSLVVDNADQQQSIGRLRQLTTDKLRELQQSIETRKSGDVNAALAVVNTDVGRRLMDDTYSLVGTMDAKENELLEQRRSRSAMIGNLVQTGAIAAFFLICISGAIGSLLARRTFTEIAQAHDQLLKSNELLSEQIDRRETAEAQLRQSQKMEAIGKLSGGIAHDFNNMLGVMAGSLDLIRRRIAANDFKIERYVNGAEEAAKRAAALTQRLLAFARQQPLEPKVVDANRMISTMSELLRSTLGEQIQIETISAGGLWTLKADVNQLENAILNVAINARDAMPEGGKLTIETANTFLDDAYSNENADVTSGQYVMIAISDTGVGMNAVTIARAFDPFFTTKPTGSGTGLGLSQVFGFVKQSEGHIKIYSEVGEGTTVKIYFPRSVSRTATDHQPVAAAVKGGSPREVILVVEDDPLMRKMSTEALRELGYTAVQSASAVQALKILEDREDIILLFTDIVMPDVNGKKLADEAVRRRPELKVLYTTGYTHNAVVHGGVLDPGVQLISKPFSLEQLANKVRLILDN